MSCSDSHSKRVQLRLRASMKAIDLVRSLEEMTDIISRKMEGREGPDDVAARWDRARALLDEMAG